MPDLSKNTDKMDKMLLLLKQRMPDQQRKTPKSDAVVDFEKVKDASICAVVTLMNIDYKKNINNRRQLIKKLRVMGITLFKYQDALGAEQDRLTTHYMKCFKTADNELLQPLLSLFTKDTCSNDFRVVNQFVQQTNIILSQLIDKITLNQSFKEILEELFLAIIEDFNDLAECVRVKNALINLCYTHDLFKEIKTHH